MHSEAPELIVVALDEHGGSVASLSVAERGRAGRFRVDTDRRRYIAAHAMLRELLSRRHGARFSLSRSEGLAAYAFTRAGAVGIDIEAIRPLEEAGAIAARIFPWREQSAYAALPESERLPGFYRAWTRTEALAKALGGGLALPREALDAALEDGWSVQSFFPAPAFAGAVAYR